MKKLWILRVPYFICFLLAAVFAGDEGCPVDLTSSVPCPPTLQNLENSATDTMGDLDESHSESTEGDSSDDDVNDVSSPDAGAPQNNDDLGS